MSEFATMDAHELADRLERDQRIRWPDNWHNEPIVLEAYLELAQRAIENIEPCPTFHGRGIVICAGGGTLFTNAWVCLRMLRQCGCQLPIQLWYLDESEMDQEMMALVKPYDAECVDAAEVRKRHPVRRLNGWELKCFALLHSPFEEVLLLDADNVPLRDPTFLFTTREFREHGAIFWPDFGRLEKDRLIWQACGVDYRNEPEFESGQLVIHKPRCWHAMNLAMHYNEHSDFYYCHVHGDKETYHLAFRRMRKSYAMPRRGICPLEATMCQHDFNGNRLFQHRNLDKWKLDGSNRSIDGFEHEATCREFLRELRGVWNGRPHWNAVPSAEEQSIISEIGGRKYRYERIGFDERLLEFQLNRTIGQGAKAMEIAWTICKGNKEVRLVLFGEDGPTCLLRYLDNSWVGRWSRFEKMPIRLTPVENG